jgi:hypothetical protein
VSEVNGKCGLKGLDLRRRGIRGVSLNQPRKGLCLRSFRRPARWSTYPARTFAAAWRVKRAVVLDVGVAEQHLFVDFSSFGVSR